MAPRNLSLGLLRRPVAPAEPAWDRLGHTALMAFAHFRDLEKAPRINGGKAGTKQVRDRMQARQRAWDLLDEWVEGRRLDGRSVDDGSMQTQVVLTTANCKRNETRNVEKM
jgi:hypothetical protein